MGFGSFDNILMFGLGTLIDLCTLAYYVLGFKSFKLFIKKSIIDNTVPQRGKNYKCSLNMLEGKTTSQCQIHERNSRKKLHSMFSYLSNKYDIEHRGWRRNLAAVLSALFEFPEYVHARFNETDNNKTGNEKRNYENSNLDVTVIVPAYNEEKGIEQILESIFNQTQPPKKVVVIDDCSTDNTSNICRELKKKYENLVYIRQVRRRGKAHNLNAATQLILEEKELYNPLTLVIDASGFLEKDFIEKIKSSFIKEDVAAASASAAVIKPESFKGKLIFEKYELMFKIYKFRKVAQNYRNTVSPVCGGCVAYRTEILKDSPIPERTHTEDTDHTWVLLEKKYRLVHNPKAIKHCLEAKTFSGFFRQWYRWYAGTFQCLYAHGKYLLKAKKLLFSTILPGFIDGFAYASFLFIAIPLYFLDPVLLLKALLWDLGITGLIMAIIKRYELKSLKYLPMVWLMKFPLIVTWLIAGLRTTWQYLRHKQYLWRFRSRAWKRPDASAADQRKIDAYELALSLKDMREEIRMLENERTELLVEKDLLSKMHKEN